MLSDFIVIDDVFENPDQIIEYAKTLKFYTNDEHPFFPKSKWSGHRTEYLENLDREAFHKILNPVLTKTINKFMNETENQFQCSFEYVASAAFHYLTENDIYNETWSHKDEKDSLLAGVVYLAKNPKENSGTVVFKNENEVVVENKFNRLVLYRANYLHHPQVGFGKDLEDGRLTFTIFIKKIALVIE